MDQSYFDQHCERFTYSAQDGLRLGGRFYQAEHSTRTPVLCLPGLTRNSKDFHQLAVFLSQHSDTPRSVLSLDYRGRGLSEYDKNWQNYSPITEADDVVAGLDASGLHHVSIIGTSRGGIITMVLAAKRPGVMRKVILNDVGPEIEGLGLKRIKMGLDRRSNPQNWADAIKAMRETIGAKFTQMSDDAWEFHTRATFAEQDGKPVSDFDPHLLNTLKNLNFDSKLPTLWPQFQGLCKTPLMVIRGENSDLLTPEIVTKMESAHPKMHSLIAKNQGHAPLLSVDGVDEAILRFLNAR